MPSFEDKLKEYARLLVAVGTNLQKGQTLLLTSQVEQAPFARLCAQAAYERGAREVVLRWNDDAMTRMKYLYAQEDVFDETPAWVVHQCTDYAREGAATLNLVASNPENLKGVDPDRILRSARSQGQALREYRELSMASAFPWCIGALASPAWAKVVFPELPEKEEKP